MKRKPNKKSASNPVVGKAVERALGLVRHSLLDSSSATKLLSQQHDEVKALIKRIEDATNRAEKRRMFEELAAKLVAHDAIEREIFYPACKRAMGMTKLLGEALVEHGVVEFCLYEADQALKREDFDFKCQVMSEIVLHHVKEEERDFFPQVEKALNRKELQTLGKRMQVRFDEAKEQDFRAALWRNLKQVLAGVVEPSKREKKSRAQGSSAAPKSQRRRAA